MDSKTESKSLVLKKLRSKSRILLTPQDSQDSSAALKKRLVDLQASVIRNATKTLEAHEILEAVIRFK